MLSEGDWKEGRRALCRYSVTEWKVSLVMAGNMLCWELGRKELEGVRELFIYGIWELTRARDLDQQDNGLGQSGSWILYQQHEDGWVKGTHQRLSHTPRTTKRVTKKR